MMKSFKWGKKKNKDSSEDLNSSSGPSSCGPSNLSLIKSFVPSENSRAIRLSGRSAAGSFKGENDVDPQKVQEGNFQRPSEDSESDGSEKWEERNSDGTARSRGGSKGEAKSLPAAVYTQLWHTRPQLERRCSLLRTKSLKGDYVLNVVFPDLIYLAKEFKFSPYTLVGDVVKKLKRYKKMPPQDHMGLYDPKEGVWMDDSLMLYQYDLAPLHTLELKMKPPREDPVHSQIHVKIIISDLNSDKLFTFPSTNITIAEVIEEVNLQVPPVKPGGRENFGLYLYNDIEGLWLEGNKSLSFYNIKSMDILELRKEPTYLLGNTKSDIMNRIELVYDTTVKDATAILCKQLVPKVQISSPSAIITLWKKTDNRRMKDEDPLWVYDLKEGDVLVIKEQPEGMFESEARGIRDALVVAASAPPSAMLQPQFEETLDSSSKEKLETVDLPRLEGEVLLKVFPSAYWKNPCARKEKVHEGDIVATNYRVAFMATDTACVMLEQDRILSIPLSTMSKIEAGKKKDSEGRKMYLLDFVCKDFRTVQFYFFDKSERNRLNLILNERSLAFPGNVERLFAFFYKPEKYTLPDPSLHESTDQLLGGDELVDKAFDGWNVYNPPDEFARQGVPNSKWRVTEINSNYEYCPSYPHFLVVPLAITDEDLKEVFAFRSKGRIPALCFRYAVNDTVLCRCSQPLAGITKNRCKADEAIFKAILAASPRGSKAEPVMYIMDARPRTNALANAAKGGGVENINGYPNCRFDYLGIPNIHEIRNSHSRLLALCSSTIDNEGPNWLSALEGTRWFEHIRSIIAGAVRVAKLMEKQKASVMLHCSDGWDRTAQLSSLVSIFLDPYYRTIKGFQVLLEKEWLSFGHKFSTRFGHGDKNHQDSQRSPIFLQFLDCVYQVHQQHVCCFEFNEKFLILIMDNLLNCRYGTFLCDTEKQRRDLRLKERTVSLWTYANEIKAELINPFYFPGMSVLIPSPSVENFVLWKGYYLRYHREKKEEYVTPQLRMLQVNSVVEGMKEHMRSLEEELKRLKEERGGGGGKGEKS